MPDMPLVGNFNRDDLGWAELGLPDAVGLEGFLSSMGELNQATSNEDGTGYAHLHGNVLVRVELLLGWIATMKSFSTWPSVLKAQPLEPYGSWPRCGKGSLSWSGRAPSCPTCGRSSCRRRGRTNLKFGFHDWGWADSAMKTFPESPPHS